MSDLQATTDTIEVAVTDGTTVVSLIGEIDADLRTQASDSMGLALLHGLPIVVDADRATFVDSSGIAFVLQLYMAAREAAIPMTLRDPNGVLRDVLTAVRSGHADDEWADDTWE